MKKCMYMAEVAVGAVAALAAEELGVVRGQVMAHSVIFLLGNDLVGSMVPVLAGQWDTGTVFRRVRPHPRREQLLDQRM